MAQTKSKSAKTKDAKSKVKKSSRKASSSKVRTNKSKPAFLTEEQCALLEKASNWAYYNYFTLPPKEINSLKVKFDQMEICLSELFSSEEIDLRVLAIIVVFALHDVYHQYNFNEKYLPSIYRSSKGIADLLNKIQQLENSEFALGKVSLDLYTVIEKVGNKPSQISKLALPIEIESPYLLYVLKTFFINLKDDDIFKALMQYNSPLLQPRKRKSGLNKIHHAKLPLMWFIEFVEPFFKLLPNRSSSQYKEDVITLLIFCSDKKWLEYPFNKDESKKGARLLVTKKARYDRIMRAKIK
jgi:hypothetical protein